MQPSWTGFALAACVLAAGCSTSSSSSSGGTDCTMFSACGGDVTGTWTLTKACTSGAPNPLATQCPSSTFQIVETVGGTINFKSDGTYSANTTSSSAGDFTLPASCLMGATCAQLQASLNQAGDGGTGTMGTCTDAAGGCSCHVTAAGSNSATTGTYSTSGTTITLNNKPSPYCVKGNGLLIQAQSGTMGMTGSGTITLAATRQ